MALNDFIAPTSAAWDRVNNISGFGPDNPIAAPPTLPVDGVSPGADRLSLHYYVRFTQSDGTTVTIDGNQLFALNESDFSFSADQTLSIGSASNGAGAGKVTFDPLRFGLGGTP